MPDHDPKYLLFGFKDKPKWWAKSYVYDSPDGQDCLKKTIHGAKVGALTGAFVSLYDIIASSKVKGTMSILGRVALFAGPAAGAFATFQVTSCLMGDIRGVDGPLNHGIGGLAGGLIIATKC